MEKRGAAYSKKDEKNDPNKSRELFTGIFDEIERLKRQYNEKYITLTNHDIAGYLDSLSIRLAYLDRKYLRDERLNIFDLRKTVCILQRDFDNADSIRYYIRQRSEQLNNPLKLEKQLRIYDTRIFRLKEQLSIPLKIEIVYDDILGRDPKYQSHMKENLNLGRCYGIFGRLP